MCVEAARLKNAIWVNSVFAVLSVFNLVSHLDGNYEVTRSYLGRYRVIMSDQYHLYQLPPKVSIVLPLASEFISLAYKIYLAIAMCHFVDLTMAWYVNLISGNQNF